jgi:hypothetical protein
MEPNGLTWSQKDTKRESKAAKMEPKAPKVRQRASNKTQKNDIQEKSVQGAFSYEGLAQQINIVRDSIIGMLDHVQSGWVYGSVGFVVVGLLRV